ncbi:MAG TPA: hypothetical protein VEC57_00080 [Candidatus Limnocylindrales bacterium]|nr:hypothetical protein [Candidatus Limnocylindrales bacterium]
MAVATKAYSDFVNREADLCGISRDLIPTDVATLWNGSFTPAIKEAWERGPWLDVCPYGEARFIGNLLTSPNNLTNAAWTATNLTVTANALANPADSRVTASKALETVTNGEHKTAQSIAFFPTTGYQVSFYARALGRSYAYLSVSDGTTTYTAFFNVSTGVIGTVSNFTNTSIQAEPNGFFLCTATLTSSSTAGSGSVALQVSTDGSTISYAGDVTKGLYFWGASLQQTTYPSPDSMLIPWDQTGESEIEAVFQVWRDSPVWPNNPRPQGYELTPSGIQIIPEFGGGGFVQPVNYVAPMPNLVWLYFRKRCPTFEGDDFDATDTYAIGDQIYYTAADGKSNYYKCLAATSAGQDPDDTPSKWELLEIPAVFFDFICYRVYSEWLLSDGQMDKAQGAEQVANNRLDQEFDRQERQMGWVLPMKVQTHVTSQARIY